MATPAERFQEMRERLEADPARLKGKDGVYQFDITGDNGGTWHVAIHGDDGSLGEGPADNPGVVITVSDTDFVAMVDGQLDGVSAFMSGKIKLKGDMGLAMKLQSILT